MNEIYICTVSKLADARKILDGARDVIRDYGYVSLADMLDLCGRRSKCSDSKIGWEGDTVSSANIMRSALGYTVFMPEFNWAAEGYKSCLSEDEREGCDEYDDPQPEPIDITIPFDRYLEHPEIIENVIQALLKTPEKIKDRPIFITFQ